MARKKKKKLTFRDVWKLFWSGQLQLTLMRIAQAERDLGTLAAQLEKSKRNRAGYTVALDPIDVRVALRVVDPAHKLARTVTERLPWLGDLEDADPEEDVSR